MSLILDALKKLDRERASRRQGMPDLAAEVLRTDSAQPRKKVRMYLLAVSLTALATAGITYAIIGKPAFLSISPSPSAGIPPAPGKQVALASPETGPQAKPPAPVPVIPPAPGQKDSPTLPALDSPAKSSPPAPTTPKKREAASVRSGAPSKPSPPAPARPPAPGRRVATVTPKPSPPAKPSPGTTSSLSASVDKVPPSPPESGVSAQSSSSAPAHPPESSHRNEIPKGTSRETKVPPGKVSKPGESVAGSSAVDPPPLKISGIVWNEEPSSRRAVINGTLLSEGSAIEGVKVVEIFPTKVRFLYQGAYFEKSIF